MYKDLIKDIENAFETKQVLVCNDTFSIEETYLKNYEDIKNPSKNNTHWKNLLTDKRYILENISQWYLNDIVFDYFLPACLIHCLQNHLQNDEVLLFLMSKFEPSFYNYNTCEYFYTLFYFDLQKRKTLREFFNLINHSTQSSNYKNEIIAAQNALAWLRKRDNLIKNIYNCLKTETTLKYDEITNNDDEDEKRVSKMLQDSLWYAPKTLENINTIILELGYYFLKPKAFAYFIPACLICNLFDPPGRRSDLTDYSINILSLIQKPKDYDDDYKRKKYSYLSRIHKELITNFLELYLTFGYYERDKRISNSLENYWLVEVKQS